MILASQHRQPDLFPGPTDPTLTTAHDLLDGFLCDCLEEQYLSGKMADIPTGRAILDAPKPVQVQVVRAALERQGWVCGAGKPALERDEIIIREEYDGWTSTNYTNRAGVLRERLSGVLEKLTGRTLPYTAPDLLSLLELLVPNMEPGSRERSTSLQETAGDELEQLNGHLKSGHPEPAVFDLYENPAPGVISVVLKQLDKQGKVDPELRPWLERLRVVVWENRFYAGYKRTVVHLDTLLGAVQPGMPEPGRAWADALLHDLQKMEPGRRAAWEALLAHAPVAGRNQPPAKWPGPARQHLAAVGEEEFLRRFSDWSGLVGKDATAHFPDATADLLKGLLWYCGLLERHDPSPLLGDLAEQCFKKLPDGGLLCSRGGLACLHSLGRLPGAAPVAQLARLRHRVKSPWGLEQIEKAFQEAAERSGLSPDELEEITLPTFGMDSDGVLRQQVGDCSAELRVSGSHQLTLSWADPDGKPLKSVPAALGRSHGEEVKALRRTASDAEKLLGAQRDRLERLLLAERSWSLSVWRERYLDHPLVSYLSRRLIWHFREGSHSAPGIWRQGQIVDVEGRPLKWLSGETEVRLWHPLGYPAEEVHRWRQLLETSGITQPFKQAHRELYVITDAEIATRTYSNRFSAHILKQHQLAALARQRGWELDYLGTWDSAEGGASINLPRWGLRAELWTQHAGGGVAESGVSLLVSTDQVRFLDGEGTLRELLDVPALLFSEVMRDVDLFVGVSSVGNDPTWRDSGAPEHQDYWNVFSFGDLTASASTRREVLERLLPRLKIASRCSLEGRFLRVRGDLRTYKIHLGSSNILMEPNDRYLCIVPDRATDRGTRGLMLPFEGDAVLSLVISKAFLLAEDRKITDPGILRQIQGK